MEFDVGPNNMLPSDLKGVPLEPLNLHWFEGGLTINMVGVNIRAAVLLDFGLDTYTLFTASAFPPEYGVYGTSTGPWLDASGVDLGLEAGSLGRHFQTTEDGLETAYSDESQYL